MSPSHRSNQEAHPKGTRLASISSAKPIATPITSLTLMKRIPIFIIHLLPLPLALFLHRDTETRRVPRRLLPRRLRLPHLCQNCLPCSRCPLFPRSPSPILLRRQRWAWISARLSSQSADRSHDRQKDKAEALMSLTRHRTVVQSHDSLFLPILQLTFLITTRFPSSRPMKIPRILPQRS